MSMVITSHHRLSPALISLSRYRHKWYSSLKTHYHNYRVRIQLFTLTQSGKNNVNLSLLSVCVTSLRNTCMFVHLNWPAVKNLFRRLV